MISFRSLGMVMAFLTLAACASDPPAPVPALEFSNTRQYPINVSRMDIRNESRAESDLFIADPAEALDRYLKTRFRPQGVQNTLEAVIEQASVTQSHKDSTNKVASFMGVAGVDEYDVALRVRLEHWDGYDRPAYSNVVKARRVIRISEHDSIAEREAKQMEGMRLMFEDLDREIQRIVLQDMKLATGPY